MGGTSDLRRVVFQMALGPVLTGAPNDALFVNDADGTRLVSILPDGTPTPAAPASYPWQRGYNDGTFVGMKAAHSGIHGVSSDGRRVFFVTIGAIPAPVYLRDDNRTLAITASQRTGDVGTVYGGHFIAATADGSQAWFESSEQLTNSAPAGGGIYRYDLASEAPTLVVPANDPAGLQLIDAMPSEDNSHLYFQTTVALTADAVGGQPNWYVYTNGAPKLIATSPTAGTMARVSRDGRYAVMRSSASLAGAPNNGHVAIYLYDAEASSLVCASCRPDGSPSEGDANLDEQSPGVLQYSFTAVRSITDDGVLFFATRDRIATADLGSATDIYEFDHGKTTMLTSGRNDADAFMADNSDDGRDVFFTTRDRLTLSDRDAGLLDLYDARRGGGFPDPAPARPACSDDGCQGAVPARPVLQAPGSSSSLGQGNAQLDPEAVKKTIKLSSMSAAARTQLAKTGHATVSVKITGGGKVGARLLATVGGRKATLASTSRTVKGTSPSTVHLKLTLTSSARKALAKHRRLKATLEVRLAGVGKAQKSTLTLVAAKR